MVFPRGTGRCVCVEGARTCVLSPAQDSIWPNPGPASRLCGHRCSPSLDPDPESPPRSAGSGVRQPLAAPSSLWPSLRGSAFRPSQSRVPCTTASVRSPKDEQHSTAITLGHRPPFVTGWWKEINPDAPHIMSFLKVYFSSSAGLVLLRRWQNASSKWLHD